jgi:hypothetical protein
MLLRVVLVGGRKEEGQKWDTQRWGKRKAAGGLNAVVVVRMKT